MTYEGPDSGALLICGGKKTVVSVLIGRIIARMRNSENGKIQPKGF
jgi:hypothetical protein